MAAGIASEKKEEVLVGGDVVTIGLDVSCDGDVFVFKIGGRSVDQKVAILVDGRDIVASIAEGRFAASG